MVQALRAQEAMVTMTTTEVTLLVGLIVVQVVLAAVALVATAQADLEAADPEEVVRVGILAVARELTPVVALLRGGWMTRSGCCWSGWSRRRRTAPRG